MGDAADVMGQFDRHLEALLPSADATPQRLHRAMRHAVLSGGKRLRPQLLLLVAEACSEGPFSAPVLRLATLAGCAVEMVHTASLIHDDLPTFDDAPLRRGRSTVHVEFDEQSAILAGDALIALAFEVVSLAPLHLADRTVRIVHSLSTAVGSRQGLTGGQSLELEVSDAFARDGAVRPQRGGEALDPSLLELCHAMKTGALFRASAEVGACAVGVEDTACWRAVGHSIGLAFQLADDLIDVFARPEVAQKPVRRDAVLGRPNAVLLCGEAKVRRDLAALFDRSKSWVTSAAIAPGRLLAWIDDLHVFVSDLTKPPG